MFLYDSLWLMFPWRRLPRFSSDFNSQNDHVYAGGTPVQSAADCASGTFPLGDAQFFESENQSAQSGSSPCDASGSM
jgi:hypothetical protein